jgi:hypothetical protein
VHPSDTIKISRTVKYHACSLSLTKSTTAASEAAAAAATTAHAHAAETAAAATTATATAHDWAWRGVQEELNVAVLHVALVLSNMSH